jgi:phosphopantothenoylcysteine decarboxylase/phosphopantothenate--cysteine ligase
MHDFQGKNIVLGISGGIAAYKSAHLARELTQLGATVRVVMTASATQFITPMTLQALTGESVRTALWDAEAERAMGHIELARWADYLLIAPATANQLAKMANGLADDLLSTLYLVATCPVFVCPAMNQSMWHHPATQANLKTLIARNIIVVGPEAGSQACGEHGLGRLIAIEEIIDALRTHTAYQQLKGQQIIITAGPTREPIDPVRYISNRSSGKMGYALAKACLMAGANVTLISGPTMLPSPIGLTYHAVETALDMEQQVLQALTPGCIFIGTAAVADYRATQTATHKLKKNKHPLNTLELTVNPDILATVATSNKAAFTVGFAAETEALIKNAQEKLKQKKIDMIVANVVSNGQGFDTWDNEVTVITKTQQYTLPRAHKARIAAALVCLIAELNSCNANHLLK